MQKNIPLSQSDIDRIIELQEKSTIRSIFENKG